MQERVVVDLDVTRAPDGQRASPVGDELLAAELDRHRPPCAHLALPHWGVEYSEDALAADLHLAADLRALGGLDREVGVVRAARRRPRCRARRVAAVRTKNRSAFSGAR